MANVDLSGGTKKLAVKLGGYCEPKAKQSQEERDCRVAALLAMTDEEKVSSLNNPDVRPGVRCSQLENSSYRSVKRIEQKAKGREQIAKASKSPQPPLPKGARRDFPRPGGICRWRNLQGELVG